MVQINMIYKQDVMGRLFQWYGHGLGAVVILFVLINSGDTHGVRSSVFASQAISSTVLTAAQCYETHETRIDGKSLEPDVGDKEEVVHLIGYYDCNEPRRDDLVTFSFRTIPDTIYVKRIVAVPGDKLLFQNNHALINGIVLTTLQGAPYLFSPTTRQIWLGPYDEGVLGASQYLVLGNNGPNSFDSRSYGYVSREQFIGRVIVAADLIHNEKSSNRDSI